MSEIWRMTVTELSKAISKGELSCREVTADFISRVNRKEKDVGAYISFMPEKALEKADELDKRRIIGKKLPELFGIPVAVKDNIMTEGIATTCASRMLAGFVPPYSATSWEKLQDDGAVLLGKCNMDEFAMGSSTENSSFHITHNPWNLMKVPGGSSGGSAACVASGEAAYALGSDTGGSIRQPASFCGVVGMKPTYGGVSRYGLVAFASSLDQIGPITKNVRDNAIVLSAITGHDRRDSTSRVYPEGTDFAMVCGKDVAGMRIGIPEEMCGEGLSREVRECIEKAARTLEKLGCRVEHVHLPSLNEALQAYYVISSAEASSNLARFDGIRYGHRAEDYGDLEEMFVRSRSEGFGDEVKRRILLGTYVLSAGYYDAYYKKAQQVRTLVKQDFSRAFEKCDVLLGPVAPTTAYGIGEKAGNPMEMYLGDIDTVSVNIAGIPALSLPGGIDSEGMPIGLQLIGPDFSESTLYRVGAALERELHVPDLQEYSERKGEKQ